MTNRFILTIINLHAVIYFISLLFLNNSIDIILAQDYKLDKKSAFIKQDEIRKYMDSIMNSRHFLMDSTLSALDIQYNLFKDSIKHINDSLLKANQKTYLTAEIDSLRKISYKLTDGLKNFTNDKKFEVKNFFDSFNRTLSEIKKENFVNINEFKEKTAGMEAGFNDSLETIIANIDESMSDSLDTILENLIELSDEFISKDKPSFLISTEIMNSYSYKGRKPKVNAPGLAPSLSYNHPLGFSAEISALWLTNKPIKNAEMNMGVGYEYDITDNFTASLTYARLFYKDSSAKYTKTLVPASTNVKVPNNPTNALTLNMDYDILSIVSFNVNAVYYFGESTDYDFSMGFARSFKFGKPFLPENFRFTTTCNLIYGMLYDTKYNIEQTTKKTVLNIDKTLRAMAIFDYDLNFSLSYDFSNLTTSLSYKIDFTANELKSASGNQFTSFSLGLSYTFE